MTGGRTAHITVTYKDSEAEIISDYALNEEISRELDRHTQKPTGRALKEWLDDKGCQLDSSGGPAFIWRFDDGTIYEQYYRNGELHREDTPAFVGRYADGSTEQQYYLDDKHMEKEQLAPVCAIPGAAAQHALPLRLFVVSALRHSFLCASQGFAIVKFLCTRRVFVPLRSQALAQPGRMQPRGRATGRYRFARGPAD
jgi:hypothetical protein